MLVLSIVMAWEHPGQPVQRTEIRTNARLKGRFYVDHDHTTGQMRALFCTNYNTASGMLNEEPQHIEALLAYRINWT